MRLLCSLLAMLALAVLACTDSTSPATPDADAGVTCRHDVDCPGGDCQGGHCVDVCAGVPHGDRCQSYGEPAVCCGEDTICCSDGFEHESCHPAAEGCPQLCPNSFSGTCPRDQICAYDPDPYNESGQCQWSESVTCVDACPAEQQCVTSGGTPMCCQAGTACVDGCCVTVPVDRPDAGPPDAAR